MIKVKLLLSLVLLATTTYAQERFNGNFESLDQQGIPRGWDFTNNHSNKFEILVDSTVKQQGKYAVSITSAPGKSASIQFPINQSFQGNSVILAGSIKTENVADGFAGLWIRVEDADGNELAFETMKNQKLTGSHDWKDYMIEVQCQLDQAAKITVGAMLLGKGKIWVDNLHFLIDGNIIEKITTDSGKYAALKDKEFDKGSGIDTILTSSAHIKYLTLLGELWGFLKYHHPVIAAGERNWDADLFRILPKVLQLKADETASALFEGWVDSLGPVPLCKDCLPTNQLKDLVIKPDYGTLFSNATFHKSLKQKLTYLIANSNNKSHYYVSLEEPANNPTFKHERWYAGSDYPDVGYRILALYRYWAMIQYYSPNRKLAQDWNITLPIFIPEVIAAQNQYGYVNTLIKLTSRTKDTHAFIGSPVYLSSLGAYRLPFQAKFIADQLVVTKYYKDTLQVSQQIKIGDVLTSINGIEVQELVKKHLPFSPASNRPTALRDIPGNFLLRSQEKLFSLKLLRAGQRLNVDQEAVKNSDIDAYRLDTDPRPTAPGFQLLSPEIGYLYCKKYRVAELNQMKEQFKNTKGIIIDMRNYPTDEMTESLSNYLKPGPSIYARTTKGSLSHPGSFQYGPPAISGNKTEDYYKGKIVVIVNEDTQSNAEWVTMVIQSSPNVMVIGSTTAGADGNISAIQLPGGFSTFISGIGVYYPNGRNAQGVGIKIDRIVKPTIKGIKNGKDELLEAAHNILLK